jgi:putative endonuclease
MTSASTYTAGRTAELAAAWFLRLKGFRIMARRYTTPVGEIDLVAKRGRLVLFVEVKRRADLMTAAEAVLPRQRQRIVRAAELFLQRRPDLGRECRFDLIAVSPWRWPIHLPDAWRP